MSTLVTDHRSPLTTRTQSSGGSGTSQGKPLVTRFSTSPGHIPLWQCQQVRPTTILLAAITAVFGGASIIFAVLIGTDQGPALSTELSLGILITLGLGVACVATGVNHRRLARLRLASGTHPDIAFVTAHAADSTAIDFQAWSPGLRVQFPCELGFDRTGMTEWSTSAVEQGTLIVARSEMLGFDLFSEPTPRSVAVRWGIRLRLAPRAHGPGVVHLWVADDQPAQDEYAMRQTIRRIESALGIDR